MNSLGLPSTGRRKRNPASFLPGGEESPRYQWVTNVMGGHDIIVLGASAGGIEASLSQLVARLPADLPAAVFVVVHIPAHSTSVLPKIFSRHGPLPAAHAMLSEPIRPGRIYVAPDHHMILRPGRVSLTRGPRENGHRPSVDPLFRSAALAYGRRVVAVVLSGSLDDGSAGLAAVKEAGGVTVVQSPDEAIYPSMPRSAMLTVKIDHVLPVAGIADLLVSMAGDPPEERPVMNPDSGPETKVRFDELDPRALHEPQHPGTPAGFGCPDCGGALWELSEGVPIRYRCRVGHAWTSAALLAEQADTMETALWTALRALEERASLCRKMSGRLKDVGSTFSAGRLKAQAEECLRSAEVIRKLIAGGRPADLYEPAAADAASAATSPSTTRRSRAPRARSPHA